MDTKQVINLASNHLKDLSGHVFDLLTLTKPISPEAAVNLAKVISKLSPLIGNLIEFNTVEFLNDQKDFQGLGTWKRQDPGFPDAIFEGSVKPTPGFEIKAWLPLATEITARFKDSQNHFMGDQTYVCLLAWLPEELIFGKPRIIDVCIVSGKSVAEARDNHYHNPPDYLIIEPENTSDRTRNLQQTNTNGYKWQGTENGFKEAQKIVQSWGENAQLYSPSIQYQQQLRQLISKFPYRLDTNFAKMDRIIHPEIEKFKKNVLNTLIHGIPISQWNKLLNGSSDESLKNYLQQKFNIGDIDTGEILQ